jgi:hypothetical protein
VLVAQVIEGVAGADLIGLLAQQLQATAHRDPMVEGASQGDQGQMRGMEDTALVRGGFDFDIGPDSRKSSADANWLGLCSTISGTETTTNR